jgi:hypothetical protein
MKKRLSEKQIISIAREVEEGYPSVNSAANTPFLMPRFKPGVRCMAVWMCRRLST